MKNIFLTLARHSTWTQGCSCTNTKCILSIPDNNTPRSISSGSYESREEFLPASSRMQPGRGPGRQPFVYYEYTRTKPLRGE